MRRRGRTSSIDYPIREVGRRRPAGDTDDVAQDVFDAAEFDATILPTPIDDANSVRRVGLTVAWHPDVARIGERVELPAGGHWLVLSRTEPVFERPDGRRSGPLADRYVSRRPVAMLANPDGGAIVDPSGGPTLSADGTPVTSRLAFEPCEITRGVVLELADRVVLVLGPTPPPTPLNDDFGLIGASEAMVRLRAEIAKTARSVRPALIRGESGTGKGIVARALHAHSQRRRGPYHAVEMAAVPASTAVAELFGEVRGALTGALIGGPLTSTDEVRAGCFDAADGGSLFLDEIGTAPAEVQDRLLRAIAMGEIQPLGELGPHRVDVRLIAATDVDLEAAVEAGHFRPALLHELTACEIRVPPLRERRDDVARLLVRFVADELAALGAANRLTAAPPSRPWLSSALAARLFRYEWPGNVLELQFAARQLALAGYNAPQTQLTPALERRLEAIVSSRRPS